MNPGGQVTLVAAPGANQIIMPVVVAIEYIPGNTLYDISPTFRIGLGAAGAADNVLRLFSVVDLALNSVTEPFVAFGARNVGDLSDVLSALSNLPLTVALSAPVTTGNGTLVAKVSYSVFSF
jgi:hypothetical protein